MRLFQRICYNSQFCLWWTHFLFYSPLIQRYNSSRGNFLPLQSRLFGCFPAENKYSRSRFDVTDLADSSCHLFCHNILYEQSACALVAGTSQVCEKIHAYFVPHFQHRQRSLFWFQGQPYGPYAFPDFLKAIDWVSVPKLHFGNLCMESANVPDALFSNVS